jgi:hypothetical protein
MNEIQPFDRPAIYRIRVNSHLGDEWSEWFDELSIIREPNGKSLLCGLVTDQASLYGLLKKARDMGLGLISVARIECDGEGPISDSATDLDVCARCQLGNVMHGKKVDIEREV